MYFSLILNRYVYHAALVKRKLIANPKLRHLVASLRLADGDQSDERPDQPQRPLRLTIDQLVSDAKSVAKTSNKKTKSFLRKGFIGRRTRTHIGVTVISCQAQNLMESSDGRFFPRAVQSI